MRDGADRIAALDRLAAQEPSLAKAQRIAQDADRLRTIADRRPSAPALPLQFFRN